MFKIVSYLYCVIIISFKCRKLSKNLFQIKKFVFFLINKTYIYNIIMYSLVWPPVFKLYDKYSYYLYKERDRESVCERESMYNVYERERER